MSSDHDIEWEAIPLHIATAIESAVPGLKRDRDLLGDRDSLSAAPILDRGFRVDPTSTVAPAGWGNRVRGEYAAWEHSIDVYLSHAIDGAPTRRALAAIKEGRLVAYALSVSSVLTGLRLHTDCTEVTREREDGRLIQSMTVTVIAETMLVEGA